MFETTIGARPILDGEVHLELVYNIGGGPKLFDSSKGPASMHVSCNNDEFKSQFLDWINDSTLFKIKGLNKFKHSYITLGNTQAIENHYNISNGRVYTFPGEYPYHTSFKDNKRIRMTDQVPMPAGPYIKHGSIVSYPFAATGNRLDDFDERMKFLDNTNVMLDFAYFGLYYSPTILDLTKYPQIHSVAFSLSKVFSTGFMRVGILLSKDELDTPLAMCNDWSYLPKLNMKLHVGLMKKFSPDFIYEKYRRKQLDLCKEHDLTPSDTVIFGLSNDAKWDKYTRNNIINRVCLSIPLQN